MCRVAYIAGMALAVTVMTTPASSQAAQEAPQQAKPKRAHDLNEVVCERQQDLGTRLGGRKICKTRAEWAEERRLSHQELDRFTTQRSCTDKKC